jgi:hypothetical protein
MITTLSQIYYMYEKVKADSALLTTKPATEHSPEAL